jgi:hypothetical protein
MVIFAVATLLLTPWKGADLPAATASAIKYQLTIKDTPGTAVALRATHVAGGWIAAFCDDHVCSPSHVRETIPASGSMMLQFELIREDERAPHRSGAVVETDDGASVAVKPQRR